MSTDAVTMQQPIEALMSGDPVRVEASTTARELAVILDENDISGVPVVDAQDRVIGVVSKTDLLHRCVVGPLGTEPASFLTAIADGLQDQPDPEALGVVSEFMEGDPVTARPAESVMDVARRMTRDRVHRVVIVDDGNHVLGIVTSMDMVKLIAG